MIFTGVYRNHCMITWQINKKCNFQCEYCFQWKNNKPLSPISPVNLSKSIDFLDKECLIHITGGEPFLEKNIIDICEEITRKHYISLNTNLSTKNIYDYADIIDPARSLFISAGIHITEREKTDVNLSSFIDKILYLQKKGFNIIANYVAFPSLLGRIKSDFAFLKSNGIQKVRVKIFRGVYKERYYPHSFSPDEKKFIEDLDADYPEFEILRKSHVYYGRLCQAGQKFFIMDRNGNLKRCSSLSRRYGNLFNKSVQFDSKPRPCPVKTCGCPYEGIRNITTMKGNSASILSEDVFEKSLKFKKVINNPMLLSRVKEKAIEYFGRQGG
jgi:MoaA/NifB/PqqE/SkfB family radical SAM enzyme